MRKAEKRRRHDAGQSEILREIAAMIALFDARVARVARIDREIADMIQVCPELAQKARLRAAVPGLCPTVLAGLPSEWPEPGPLRRHKIASLAGLAPQARESGTWPRTRPVRGRRRKVPKGALHRRPHRVPDGPRPRCIATPDDCGPQAPGTTLIAAVRQLLTVLAMIRKNQPLRS